MTGTEPTPQRTDALPPAVPAEAGEPEGSPVLPGKGCRVVLLTCWLLGAVCAVALAVGEWLPWLWPAEKADAPLGLSGFLIVVLGPVASLIAVGTAVLGRDDWRDGRLVRDAPERPVKLWFLFSATAVVCVLVGMQLLVAEVEAFEKHSFRVGLGGPIAVLSAAGLTACWLTLAIAGVTRRGRVSVRVLMRRAGRMPWLASVLVVVLLGAGSTVAVRWLAESRFVDHTTATPLPATPMAAPARLDRTKWRVRTEGLLASTVVGRYVVLGERRGVRVLDATTGQEHWHYWHRSMSAERAMVSADGNTVFLLFGINGLDFMAVGLDVATGTVRWQLDQPQDLPKLLLNRSLDDGPRATAAVAGDVVVLAGTCGQSFCSGLAAYDAHTGRHRWTWRPQFADDSEECGVTQVVGGSEQFLIAEDCITRDLTRPDGEEYLGNRARVTALAADNGTSRWGWRQAKATGLYPFSQPYLSLAGDEIVVSHDTTPPEGESESQLPRRMVRLSARDGAQGWDHIDPRGADHLLPPVVVDGVAVFPGRTVSIGVDAATGTQRWRRNTPQLSGWSAEVAATAGNRSYQLLVRTTEDQAVDGYRYPKSGTVRIAAISATDGTVDISPDISLRPGRLPSEDTEFCSDDCTQFASPYLGIGPGVLVATADSPSEHSGIDVVGIG